MIDSEVSIILSWSLLNQLKETYASKSRTRTSEKELPLDKGVGLAAKEGVGKYLLAWLVMVTAAGAAAPNIVVILSDDMGYSDISCYGGELRTPNLDALAARGIRFTQFYNTARCCPTRAALLTGLYPHQAGVGHMMNDRGHDGYRGDLNQNCVTIPEALKRAGYRSYAVGKWHVTRHMQPEGPKHNWPLQRGFDRYYGTIHGGGSYFDPSTLTRDNTPISPFADPEYRPKTFYYTDAISDHAVRFVADHQKQHRDKPFFLYVAYTAAHWPMPWELYDMEADRTEINNLAGKYPDRARKLAAQWDAWAARANVLPLGTWRAKTSTSPTL